MQELVFVVAHEPGTNPVADRLAETPAARVRTLACHATGRSLWRLDRATGPAGTLDALEELAGARYFVDCLVRDDDALPAAQADALEAAVEVGYYETPREVEAYELADRLGVPGSTLTYRLRRAEAWLAKRYVR